MKLSFSEAYVIKNKFCFYVILSKNNYPKKIKSVLMLKTKNKLFQVFCYIAFDASEEVFAIGCRNEFFAYDVFVKLLIAS